MGREKESKYESEGGNRPVERGSYISWIGKDEKTGLLLCFNEICALLNISAFVKSAQLLFYFKIESSEPFALSLQTISSSLSLPCLFFLGFHLFQEHQLAVKL